MSTSASEFLVGKADAGTRLDHFLTAHATDLSRSRLQALVRDGSVTVDGAIVSPGKKLRAGERIILTVPLAVAGALFGLWGRALDGTEVEELYNGGDGLAYAEL